MTGADATPVVAVKILVEKNVILEVLVVLHFGILVVHRTMSGFVVGEDRSQTAGELVGGLADCRFLARSGWAFDLEIVPVVPMKLF